MIRSGFGGGGGGSAEAEAGAANPSTAIANTKTTIRRVPATASAIACLLWREDPMDRLCAGTVVAGVSSRLPQSNCSQITLS